MTNNASRFTTKIRPNGPEKSAIKNTLSLFGLPFGSTETQTTNVGQNGPKNSQLSYMQFAPQLNNQAPTSPFRSRRVNGPSAFYQTPHCMINLSSLELRAEGGQSQKNNTSILSSPQSSPALMLSHNKFAYTNTPPSKEKEKKDNVKKNTPKTSSNPKEKDVSGKKSKQASQPEDDKAVSSNCLAFSENKDLFDQDWILIKPETIAIADLYHAEQDLHTYLKERNWVIPKDGQDYTVFFGLVRAMVVSVFKRVDTGSIDQMTQLILKINTSLEEVRFNLWDSMNAFDNTFEKMTSLIKIKKHDKTTCADIQAIVTEIKGVVDTIHIKGFKIHEKRKVPDLVLAALKERLSQAFLRISTQEKEYTRKKKKLFKLLDAMITTIHDQRTLQLTPSSVALSSSEPPGSSQNKTSNLGSSGVASSMPTLPTLPNDQEPVFFSISTLLKTLWTLSLTTKKKNTKEKDFILDLLNGISDGEPHDSLFFHDDNLDACLHYLEVEGLKKKLGGHKNVQKEDTSSPSLPSESKKQTTSERKISKGKEIVSNLPPPSHSQSSEESTTSEEISKGKEIVFNVSFSSGEEFRTNEEISKGKEIVPNVPYSSPLSPSEAREVASRIVTLRDALRFQKYRLIDEALKDNTAGDKQAFFSKMDASKISNVSIKKLINIMAHLTKSRSLGDTSRKAFRKWKWSRTRSFLKETGYLVAYLYSAEKEYKRLEEKYIYGYQEKADALAKCSLQGYITKEWPFNGSWENISKLLGIDEKSLGKVGASLHDFGPIKACVEQGVYNGKLLKKTLADLNGISQTLLRSSPLHNALGQKPDHDGPRMLGQDMLRETVRRMEIFNPYYSAHHLYDRKNGKTTIDPSVTEAFKKRCSVIEKSIDNKLRHRIKKSAADCKKDLETLERCLLQRQGDIQNFSAMKRAFMETVEGKSYVLKTKDLAHLFSWSGIGALDMRLDKELKLSNHDKAIHLMGKLSEDLAKISDEAIEKFKTDLPNTITTLSSGSTLSDYNAPITSLGEAEKTNLQNMFCTFLPSLGAFFDSTLTADLSTREEQLSVSAWICRHMITMRSLTCTLLDRDQVVKKVLDEWVSSIHYRQGLVDKALISEAKQVIRTAILLHWGEEGGIKILTENDGKNRLYTPYTQKDEIEETLHSWKFPVDLFRPELDLALQTYMDRESLLAWRDECRATPAYVPPPQYIPPGPSDDDPITPKQPPNENVEVPPAPLPIETLWRHTRLEDLVVERLEEETTRIRIEDTPLHEALSILYAHAQEAFAHNPWLLSELKQGSDNGPNDAMKKVRLKQFSKSQTHVLDQSSHSISHGTTPEDKTRVQERKHREIKILDCARNIIQLAALELWKDDILEAYERTFVTNKSKDNALFFTVSPSLLDNIEDSTSSSTEEIEDSTSPSTEEIEKRTEALRAKIDEFFKRQDLPKLEELPPFDAYEFSTYFLPEIRSVAKGNFFVDLHVSMGAPKSKTGLEKTSDVLAHRQDMDPVLKEKFLSNLQNAEPNDTYYFEEKNTVQLNTGFSSQLALFFRKFSALLERVFQGEIPSLSIMDPIAYLGLTNQEKADYEFLNNGLRILMRRGRSIDLLGQLLIGNSLKNVLSPYSSSRLLGLLSNVTARIDVFFGLQAYFATSGSSVTFSPTEKGLRALLDLTEKMIDQKEITIKDLTEAIAIGSIYEKSFTINTTGDVLGRIENPSFSGLREVVDGTHSPTPEVLKLMTTADGNTVLDAPAGVDVVHTITEGGANVWKIPVQVPNKNSDTMVTYIVNQDGYNILGIPAGVKIDETITAEGATLLRIPVQAMRLITPGWWDQWSPTPHLGGQLIFNLAFSRMYKGIEYIGPNEQMDKRILADTASMGRFLQFIARPWTYAFANPIWAEESLNVSDVRSHQKLLKIWKDRNGYMRNNFVTSGSLVANLHSLDPALTKFISCTDDDANTYPYEGDIEEHHAFRRTFKNFIRQAENTDFLFVIEELKPECLSCINFYLDKAKWLRRQGQENKAKKYENKANTLAEDPKNYYPTYAYLIPVDTKNTEEADGRTTFLGKWSSGNFDFETARHILKIPRITEKNADKIVGSDPPKTKSPSLKKKSKKNDIVINAAHLLMDETKDDSCDDAELEITGQGGLPKVTWHGNTSSITEDYYPKSAQDSQESTTAIIHSPINSKDVKKENDDQRIKLEDVTHVSPGNENVVSEEQKTSAPKKKRKKSSVVINDTGREIINQDAEHQSDFVGSDPPKTKSPAPKKKRKKSSVVINDTGREIINQDAEHQSDFVGSDPLKIKSPSPEKKHKKSDVVINTSDLFTGEMEDNLFDDTGWEITNQDAVSISTQEKPQVTWHNNTLSITEDYTSESAQDSQERTIPIIDSPINSKDVEKDNDDKDIELEDFTHVSSNNEKEVSEEQTTPPQNQTPPQNRGMLGRTVTTVASTGASLWSALPRWYSSPKSPDKK